jgi:hypothetical protein
MPGALYRDLASFGLPFVTPGDPTFQSLAEEILSGTIGPQPDTGFENAAVLLNRSGKAVIALAIIWKYLEPGGHARMSTIVNLGSSMQMDVLAGRAEVARDRFSFFLPGSKRLITEQGFFGDNSDVVPAGTSGGGGSSRSGGGGRVGFDGALERIELQLDAVFFEDGLFVGPDELGMFDSVTSDLEIQRNMARELAAALRSGASAGVLFEKLRPLAAHPHPTGGDRQTKHRLSQLGTLFARMAIDRLINQTNEELLAWFDNVGAPSRLALRRV